MSRRLQRTLLLLGSVLVALVLAEASLWALGIPKDIPSFGFLGNVFEQAGVFEEDPSLFWRLRKDTDRFRANDMGLRGPEVPIPKAGADLRVACLGDSCTFGSDVRLEDTYGWLLQEYLQDRLPERRVQVILAALPGYSSYQSLVLFKKDIAPRKPDLCVLYIGGYNDYVPAIGESDNRRGALLAAERNSLWRRWRLVRLPARILAPQPKLTAAEYVAAFEKGEAPDGRRVPLADFKTNLEKLIASAQEIGSKVLVLVPPLPQCTLEKHAIALEYRQVIRSVAQTSGARLVDPTPAFASRAVSADADLPKHQRGYWPCFVDWVHPSVLGHRLLAKALEESLRDESFSFAYPTSTPNPGSAMKLQLSPTHVTAARREKVFVRCETRQVWDDASRTMVGPWWTPYQYFKSVRSVGFHLPSGVPPGTYPVHLVTNLGRITCSERLEVKPPRLDAKISRYGNKVTLRFQITGPEGWAAGVWVSTEKRETPAPTRFGPFHLAAKPDGRLPDAGDDTPFMFLRLKLPQAAGTIPAGGTWRHETQIDLDKLAVVPAKVQVQGLMHRDQAHGLLTEVVTLVVPQ